jgi:hypothetical protein
VLGSTVTVALTLGLFAALVSAAVLASRRRSLQKMGGLLVPFLSGGAVVALFSGGAILDSYLGLF